MVLKIWPLEHHMRRMVLFTSIWVVALDWKASLLKLLRQVICLIQSILRLLDTRFRVRNKRFNFECKSYFVTFIVKAILILIEILILICWLALMKVMLLYFCVQDQSLKLKPQSRVIWLRLTPIPKGAVMILRAKLHVSVCSHASNYLATQKCPHCNIALKLRLSLVIWLIWLWIVCKLNLLLSFVGKKYYRAVFKSSIESDTPNIVERNISLGYSYSQEYCSKEVIYLKSLQDIQSSVNTFLLFLPSDFWMFYVF